MKWGQFGQITGRCLDEDNQIPVEVELLLKTLQSRGLLQGLIKQREIELSCDISTVQYQSSSGLLRYHEFTEIYMKENNDRKLHNMTWYGVAT